MDHIPISAKSSPPFGRCLVLAVKEAITTKALLSFMIDGMQFTMTVDLFRLQNTLFPVAEKVVKQIQSQATTEAYP